MEPYFKPEALRMCYHFYCTQKNESLNRKVIARAPKNRFFGGTSTLADYLRMIVIENSVGLCEAINQIFSNLQLPKNPVLSNRVKRQDKENSKKKIYKKRRRVKILQSQKKKLVLSCGVQPIKNKKLSNANCEHGIGIKNIDIAFPN